jgi:hypothetical protein
MTMICTTELKYFVNLILKEVFSNGGKGNARPKPIILVKMKLFE